MEKVFGERRYYLSNTYSDNSFSDTFKNILLLTSTMDYDLELNKIIETVKKNKYKTVLLQLPDGLKPKAKDIVDELLSKTTAEVMIWSGSCYGACDIPLGIKELGVDLFVQLGHNAFKKTNGW